MNYFVWFYRRRCHFPRLFFKYDDIKYCHCGIRMAGYTLFHGGKITDFVWYPPLSVCPSVCGQNRVSSVTSTVLAGSISYLHIIIGNFRCVALKVIGKIPNVNFWKKCQICNFDLVFVWLDIWYESIIWTIMGRPGYSQNAAVLPVLVL